MCFQTHAQLMHERIHFRTHTRHMHTPERKTAFSIQIQHVFCLKQNLALPAMTPPSASDAEILKRMRALGFCGVQVELA